jgi:hypothetical protein
MINWDNKDRKQLITLLKDLPELATEQSRLQILKNAGLEQVVSQINLSGAPLVAVSEIVNYLSSYGRLTNDQETLGLFLDTIRDYVGVQQQEFLDKLLLKYDMMTPIAPLPNIDHWKGGETTEEVLEKIIGENTLRPIAFLEQGVKVARSVVYIKVQSIQKRLSATGFLVSEDLLLTNNHVLPSRDLLKDSIFRFNYQDDFLGYAQPCEEYLAKLNGFFYTNQELDYSLVQLDNFPGKQWGYLPLSSRKLEKKERVNIIQHPAGRSKEVSFQNNFVEYIDKKIVQYVTSTLNGSSGSPVLNDAWEVVALHHAGGNLPEPITQRRYFRNEGILIGRILADLPPDIKGMLKPEAR